MNHNSGSIEILTACLLPIVLAVILLPLLRFSTQEVNTDTTEPVTNYISQSDEIVYKELPPDNPVYIRNCRGNEELHYIREGVFEMCVVK